MKIAVCGIACEKCQRMVAKTCPNYPQGCQPKENKFCLIASCAFEKGVKLCFACAEFPCYHKNRADRLRLLPVHFRQRLMFRIQDQ